MALEAVLDVRAVPQYVAFALMLALATWLLRLDFNARANRAFALFLFFRAMTLLLSTFSRFDAAGPWDRLSGYYYIAVFPAVLYFVSVYPTPRGWFGKHPAGPWTLVAAGLALEAWFALDHCAYVCPVPGTDLFHIGPLFAVVLSFVLGLVGLAFVREHLRSPPGPRRQSYLLVGAVLVVNSLFDGLRSLGEVAAAGTVDPAAYALVPNVWALLNLTTGPLTLVPVFASVGLLVAHWRGTPAARSLLPRFAVVAALAFLTGIVVGFGPGLSATGLGITILGLWRIAIPLGITYAIVRHQLLDIDVKVKGTLNKGTIAAVFAAVYFSISEASEALVADQFSGDFSTVAALATAAVLSVTVDPIRAAAGKVTEFFMPGVDLSPDHLRARRHEVYRVAFESVIEDGVMTAKERAVLARLRSKLDLPDEEAARIEVAVERARGAMPA